MTAVWNKLKSEGGGEPIVITNYGNVTVRTATFTVTSTTFPNGSIPSGNELNLYDSDGTLIISIPLNSTGVGAATPARLYLTLGASWNGYLEVLVPSANSPYSYTCTWSVAFS